MTSFFQVANAAASFVVAVAAAYFFLAAGLGVRQLRRTGTPLGFQASIQFGHPFDRIDGSPEVDRAAWKLYFLIPCLNEAEVIGQTVTTLLDPSCRSRVIVIDDGSDDETSAVAHAAGGPRVRVLRRELPEARQGKGAALNAGFAAILADVELRRLNADQVIVCVMDADGHLSDGAIDEVLALFANPAVGGAQLAVRIRNRGDNFLLQFQDHQFWTLSSLTQFGRIGTGTVSLGGNGQFTRLSAMIELGEQPWSNALTEDLDLALSLASRGWNLTSTPRAAVDQQGLRDFRPLLKQRTRWYQGHMMAIRRLPEVLRSTKIGNAAAIEMSLYLLVPWLLDLPWSILYHVILVEIGLRIAGSGVAHSSPLAIAVNGVVWYLLAFWPALVTAVMAKRRDKAMTSRRAIKLGHAFVLTNYLSYICAWSALIRICRGQNSWTKTARIVEAAPTAPVTVPMAESAAA